MDKKKLIIVCVTVVAVAMLVIAISVGKKDNSKAVSENPTPSQQNDRAQSDEKDLGLCKIIAIADIKSALGSAAATLSGPNNTGVTSLGDGDKGQTCVYPFTEGGDVSNSFYTDLAQYSQESFDKVADFTATSGTPVSGVGDKATYAAGQPLTGSKEFTITAVKGTNVYLFVISQPKDAASFDEASALKALTTIAQSAKLN